MGTKDSTLKILKFEENHDRISNLPEPIIHHIFSFLETIDVIRASAVSKNWRSLWVSLPYLNFNKLGRWSLETFKDFVNWVLLAQNGSSDIQRLRLSYLYYPDDYTIHRWMNIVARRNVQELDLNINSETLFELPHCLLNCQSLVVFKLVYVKQCTFKLPSFGGFSHLKSLELVNAKLSDETVTRNFISSCPLLEKLKMKGCIFCGFKVLDISAVNLKELSLLYNGENERGIFNTTFKIGCQSLLSFYHEGALPKKFLLENLSSLDNASIIVDGVDYFSKEERGNITHEILEGLENVKVLELDIVFASYFCYAFAKPRGVFSSFHSLKSLKLGMGLCRCYLELVIHLLKCSPHLEALGIEFGPECQSDGAWEIRDEAITCLTYHLKVVKILIADGDEDETNQNETELIRFLLKNGHVLEKVSVIWQIGLQESRETIQEVMKYPRSSSNVSLTFLAEVVTQHC